MSLSVSCPECGTPLEVDDEYRDWKVRCPRCRHEFHAVPMPPVAQTPDRESEWDEDSERQRPRRRRRRMRDEEDDDWVDAEAGAQEIAGPAAWLEAIGWVSLVLAVLACAGIVAYGISEANQPRPANGLNKAKDDDPAVLIFVGFCVGVFALPYFGLIAFGARKMRNLSSHGWGMASAIMAIAALPLFGPCGLPIFGPGIWALVVLNRLNVKAAFQRNRRRNRRDDDEDD
jgi:predicted Zn finger-like uncharacterized protein